MKILILGPIISTFLHINTDMVLSFPTNVWQIDSKHVSEAKTLQWNSYSSIFMGALYEYWVVFYDNIKYAK